jgi:hypothetical protein
VDSAPWAPASASDLVAAVDARITFPGFPNARLRASEDVDMRVDASDPRRAYIYQFVIDDRSVFAYHRQPDHKPCDHRHDYGTGEVVPAMRTLPQVVREAQA